MNVTRILASIFELGLTVLMAVLVVYATLRALIRSNTDFNEDKELAKGNVAVGILVASLLIASANIMYQAFEPVAAMIRRHLSPGIASGGDPWRLALIAAGNLVLAFVVVVATMSFSLRVFGRLTRSKGMRAGKELEKGNVAVGILLAAVVFIVSLFVGEGVKALSKAIMPRPSSGMMRVME
ncbi:MAG: DUF350 domain-containing protein [Elusimicrobiota bacterium]